VTSDCLWVEVGQEGTVCVPSREPYLLNTPVRRIVEGASECLRSLWPSATATVVLEEVEETSTMAFVGATTAGGNSAAFLGGKRGRESVRTVYILFIFLQCTYTRAFQFAGVAVGVVVGVGLTGAAVWLMFRWYRRQLETVRNTIPQFRRRPERAQAARAPPPRPPVVVVAAGPVGNLVGEDAPPPSPHIGVRDPREDVEEALVGGGGAPPPPPNRAEWDEEAGAFFEDVPLSPQGGVPDPVRPGSRRSDDGMPVLVPMVGRRTGRQRRPPPRFDLEGW